MERVLDLDHILEIIPHRFENILIDSITLNEEGENRLGKAQLCFNSDDPQGRDIFIVTDSDGSSVYYPYMFLEFSALGAITLMEEKIKQGLTAVFSSIRKVSTAKKVSAGTQLISNITLQSVTSGFHRFAGSIEADSEQICSLQIMAYGVDFGSDEEARESEAKKIEIPEMESNEPAGAALFPYKKEGLVFADAVRTYSEESRTIITEYNYTDSYPFIRGHFPGNPVMMGITQVIMGADAAGLLAARLGLEGSDASADCCIFKGDGAIVCDIKGLSLKIGAPDSYPEFLGVKSVAFRDLVTPDEMLYCRAEIK